MPLISAEYREQNRLLHETEPHYGISGGKYQQWTQRTYEIDGHESALDYGCGKGILKQMCPAIPMAEYDPAIPGKDNLPEPADLVICTDVLEHIEPKFLNSVLRDLVRVTRKKLMLSIATRPATNSTLPDGRNPHLIIRDEVWWRAKLTEHFQIVLWNPGEGEQIVCEAIPITGKVMTLEERAATGKRRPVAPIWYQMFNEIRANNAKYIDDFSALKTISMWEGVDDTPHDMHIVLKILEDMADIDLAIKAILKVTRKVVMIHVALTPQKTEKIWRNILERYFRIADWHVSDCGGYLLMSGAPMVAVQGLTAIGAVDSEERFEQVRMNSRRISKRIERAPAHDKVAIIACYGPSLKGTLQALQDEARSSGGTVVSVSGAHDFLLAQGIVPDYHVECDPRPHKADNIAKPIDGVKYLIASTCHAATFSKLEGGDIHLWHVSTPEHAKRLVDEIGEKGEHCISGGGSVGLRSIPLLYQLGYRDFRIFGMDCSFSDDGADQWAGPHAGKRQDLVQCNCAVPGQAEPRIFTTSPILLSYATGFFETVQRIEDVSFRLYGDGLLQSMSLLYAHIPQQQRAA